MAAPSQTVTAAMLIIGAEILSGRTQDTNLRHFAPRLADRGIRMGEVRIVGDVQSEIVAGLNALRAAHDLVFTTGGIGPTHDDITADAIAAAFGVPIGEDPRALALLSAYYGPGPEFTPGRQRMARIPEGAILIPNSISAAPGFRLGNVYVMAGIPRVAAAMLEAVIETLPAGIRSETVTLTARVAEGRIADALRATQARHPAVEIGSYPSYAGDTYRTTLVLRGPDPERLRACRSEVVGLLRGAGAEPEEGEPVGEPERPEAVPGLGAATVPKP